MKLSKCSLSPQVGHHWHNMLRLTFVSVDVYCTDVRHCWRLPLLTFVTVDVCHSGRFLYWCLSSLKFSALISVDVAVFGCHMVATLLPSFSERLRIRSLALIRTFTSLWSLWTRSSALSSRWIRDLWIVHNGNLLKMMVPRTSSVSSLVPDIDFGITKNSHTYSFFQSSCQ